jgi:DUF917 family protein
MLDPPGRLVRIDADALHALERGCALLSSGAENPWMARMSAAVAIGEQGAVDVVTLDALDDDTLVMPCGQIGSARLAVERVWSGDEGAVLREAVERRTGGRVAALMPFEIGGANGLLPITWAARLGLPLVDADGMGRSFPSLRQQAMSLAGERCCPLWVTDGRANIVAVECEDDATAERLALAAAGGMGGIGVVALHTMSAARARDAAVRGSLSGALALGRASPETLPTVFEGWVTAVDRRAGEGQVVIRDGSRWMRLELRDGFLLALEDGAVVASVPDVIAVIAVESGEPIALDELRHGREVAVSVLPVPAVWATPEGLALAGPSAFGLDVDHWPYGG